MSSLSRLRLGCSPTMTWPWAAPDQISDEEIGAVRARYPFGRAVGNPCPRSRMLRGMLLGSWPSRVQPQRRSGLEARWYLAHLHANLTKRCGLAVAAAAAGLPASTPPIK